MKRAILLLALGVPTSLAAQKANTTISSYVAADDGVANSPLLVGLNIVRERGWTATRVSAAVDAGSTLFGSSDGAGSVGVISADLDAMLYFGGPAGRAPVIPYAFVGTGGRMLSGASSGAALTWGYGVGARTPLGDRLSMEGEVRYREPLVGGDPEGGQSAGLEYRFGMSVRVGRGVGGAAGGVRGPARIPVSRPTSVPVELGAAAAARRVIAQRALDTADDYLGVRYTWGGNTPDEGFDCSGFIKFVYAHQGISLPRVSRDQARAGIPLPLEIAAFEPGDLIAFAPEPGSQVNHIAIYAGNGQIIHSSSSGNGVRFDDLYSQRGTWYRTHMVAAVRVIDGGAGLFFGE